MLLIIDRFEEKFAICETEEQKFINIELASLPNGVKEGDVIRSENGGITIDIEETQKRRKAAEDFLKLWN